MHLYVVGHRETVEGWWEPVGSEVPGWSAVRLRHGACILTVPERLADESGVLYLGDDPQAKLSKPIRRTIENRLGLGRDDLAAEQMRGSTVDGRCILADLLTVHADRLGVNPLAKMRDGLLRIFLAGEVWWAKAVPAGGATVTESFTQADSTTLGPDLTWTEVLGDWETISNEATTSTAATQSDAARAEHDLATVDHYAESPAYPEDAGDHSHFGGTRVRFQSDANTCYWGGLKRNGNNVEIFLVEAGGNTRIAQVSFTVQSGVVYTIRTEVEGSTIRVLIDGTEEASVTDTTIAGNTRTGIGYYTLNDRWFFQSFEAGDLSAGTGVTVDATVADTASDAPAPEVATGVTVDATAADTASDTPEPTVGAGVTVDATTVDTTGDTPQPTVTAGTGVTVAPLPADAAGDTLNPTVSTAVTITPLPADAAGDALPVTVTAATGGDVTVEATVADTTGDTPTPTVSTAVTITPLPADGTADSAGATVAAGTGTTVEASTVDSTADLLNPAVGVGVTITPLPVDTSSDATPATVAYGATVTSTVADATVDFLPATVTISDAAADTAAIQITLTEPSYAVTVTEPDMPTLTEPAYNVTVTEGT